MSTACCLATLGLAQVTASAMSLHSLPAYSPIWKGMCCAVRQCSHSSHWRRPMLLAMQFIVSMGQPCCPKSGKNSVRRPTLSPELPVGLRLAHQLQGRRCWVQASACPRPAFPTEAARQRHVAAPPLPSRALPGTCVREQGWPQRKLHPQTATVQKDSAVEASARIGVRPCLRRASGSAHSVCHACQQHGRGILGSNNYLLSCQTWRWQAAAAARALPCA
jgi:hypothetical protein